MQQDSFFSEHFEFLCQYHSTNAPYLLTYNERYVNLTIQSVASQRS